jgi:hypothetical protein
MSATIYSPPAHIKEPEITFQNVELWRERNEKYVKELKAFCLQRKKGKNVGEIIYFPVADGQAQYMVASLRPLELIHLPLDDAWQFSYAHLLTAKEVNEKIENQKALNKIFGGS